MITLITTTSDNRSELDKLSYSLVKQRLAACGQVEGPITSTYTWESKITTSEEFKLTVKTTRKKATEVETYIREHHSYDLPEVMIFEIGASSEYEAWVEQETT